MLGRLDRASESRFSVTASLPKVLWLLWLQGWSEAPPVAPEEVMELGAGYRRVVDSGRAAMRAALARL